MSQGFSKLIFSALMALLYPNDNVSSKIIYVYSNDDVVKVLAQQNVRYIIKDNLDLDGKIVQVGKGCKLDFRGGSFSNGTIIGDDTIIEAGNYEIFRRGYTRFRAYKTADISKNAHPHLVKKHLNSIVVKGTWNNSYCKANWTGLQNESSEDVMLALKNYVVLHKRNSDVVIPRINAFGYESTTIPKDYNIDFNGSIISYPDDLDIWLDDKAELPDGAIPCHLESGYGLISLSDNTTISNLVLDGKSSCRADEPVKFGVSCLIAIGNAKNVRFNNVSINNVLGPAVTAQQKSENIKFDNCHFYNIGEHIVYSHQYLGFCIFNNCTFDTWDSERLSVARKGLNYLYKFNPPAVSDNISYQDIYKFVLEFNNCKINNPRRVNSEGRTLGGFITSTAPLTIKLNHCELTGVMPPFNPSGGSVPTETLGMCNKLIVKDCLGAPSIYSSNHCYNIIAEYYNCKKLDFSTIYSKVYDNCEIRIDSYNSSKENVSSSFDSEFLKPLFVSNCTFYDEGSDFVRHTVIHRPVVFKKCKFKESVSRKKSVCFLDLRKAKNKEVILEDCEVEMNKVKFVLGGSIRVINNK